MGVISAVAVLAGINTALMICLVLWVRSNLKSFEAEIRGWNKRER